MKKVLIAFLETLEEKDRIIEDMRRANREREAEVKERNEEFIKLKKALETSRKEIEELNADIMSLEKEYEEVKAELAVYKGESEVNEDDDF